MRKCPWCTHPSKWWDPFLYTVILWAVAKAQGIPLVPRLTCFVVLGYLLIALFIASILKVWIQPKYPYFLFKRPDSGPGSWPWFTDASTWA